VSGSRTRVALLLALTFVAGIAAGVAADRQLGGARAEAPKQADEDHRRDRRGGGTTIERFADELGLTDEQRARIDPILEETRERMSELFEPVRPAYRELVDSTRARIEAVLTPEQVADYRELLERDYGDDRKGRDRDRVGDTERDTTESDTENR
jgi:Spy/CpxP family protein refolding chaperone